MDFYLVEHHKLQRLGQQRQISRNTKARAWGGSIASSLDLALLSQGIHEESTTKMNGIVMSPGVWGDQRNLGPGADENT